MGSTPEEAGPHFREGVRLFFEDAHLARIIHDSTSFFISTRCTRAIYLS